MAIFIRQNCGIGDLDASPVLYLIPNPHSRLSSSSTSFRLCGILAVAVHPVVFQWGPLVIRWYGVMMAITVLTTAAMALRMGPRLGVPAREIDRLILPFVLVAFVGARLGYVLSHPAEFISPVEVLRIYHGGLTSHGAIAGGVLALWWGLRRRGLPLWGPAQGPSRVVAPGDNF